MILVMDIGNSNMVMGIYDNDELTHHWRMETDRHKTEDEYGMKIKAFLQDVGLEFSNIKGIIMSSVVPPIMFSLERMALKYFG
jgi:type III pantothenate kinase